MDKQRGTRCIMHACASSFLPQMGVSSNQRPIRVVHASDARLDRNYRRSNSLSLFLSPSFFLSFSLSSEEEAVKQVSLCFHDKSVSSAVYPAPNFNLGYDKGINFVRGRRAGRLLFRLVAISCYATMVFELLRE